MFGHRNQRRRASSASAPNPPPNSSASLAATKAFMRNQDSNASLSSSAAAAALRTHPLAPTPVGQTITKRMARKGSVSSQGSGSQQAPGLRRHSSSGSMTERTFRDPSPARSSPTDRSAPPVPKLPQTVPDTSVAHRRASSLEPAHRGGSPVGRGGGRGVSLDRGVAKNSDRGHPHVSSLSQVPEDEQNGNQQSVNFSRPISPFQTTTPRPATSARGGHSGWFVGPVVNPNASFRGAKPRPQTSSGYSAFDAHATQQAVRSAADRPVSTHKAPLSQGLEGARLASGSLRAKQNPYTAQSRQPQAQVPRQDPPRTVDPNSPFAVYDPSTRTFIHKQDAMALHRAISDAEEPPPRYEQHHREPPQQRQPQRQPSQTRQAPPQVAERPYIPEQARAPVAQTATASKHTSETPTPHSSGAALPRRSSEDYADEDIRPAPNANTGRKLGSSETAQDEPLSPKFASNQSSAYPRIDTTVATVATPRGVPSQVATRAERTHSMSPQRNAHFAPVSLEIPNDIMHQPPPRSVSPAKSALKSSPSVSRRGNSPIANDGRLVAQGPASEASDAMSDDGSKKKKKTVRVSFDEDPVVAGTSAYAEEMSPEKGLGASRWSSANEDEDLQDDYMKPRPVLPSFGSVRDKDRRPREGDAAEKVTETVSSSLSNSAISASEPPIDISSDQLIGGILASEFASKTAASSGPQDPLPPEVTSVEGTGYVSDSDQSEASGSQLPVHKPDESRLDSEPLQSMPEPEPKTLTAPADNRSSVDEVPVIAVQPATPSLVEKAEPKFQRQLVPGGWDDEETPDSETATQTTTEAPHVPSAISFANMEALDSHYGQADSSDDDSSIYSDAYEDLSEVEDGGFASIDAVVESPIVSPSTGLMASKFAEAEAAQSALRREYKEDISTPVARSSTERNVPRQDVGKVSETPKQGKPAKNVTKDPAPATRSAPVRAKVQPEPVAISERNTPTVKTPKPTAQPRKSALKKPAASAQTAAAGERPAAGNMATNEPRMKKSMRNSTGPRPVTSPEPQMRKTMRGASVEGSRQTPGLAASRYSSPPPETKPPRGALQKRNIPAASAAKSVSGPRPQSASYATPSKASKSAPVSAYDSDSDASQSSFQRTRPRASRKEGGRYTMRGSMRSGPAPTMRATPTQTMRPTSPVQSASQPPSMRKSMRASSPNVESPGNAGVKSSRFSIRSLSPAGRFRPKSSGIDVPPPLPTQSPKRTSMFGKSSKPKPAATSNKPVYKSRFADSSDEEDDQPRGFQSRFADSDDDDVFELPPDLTPVRGIPKRPGEEDGDSTDLEEELSDAEPSSKAGKGKNPATNGATNGQGSTFNAGSLRTSKHATPLPEMEAGKKAKTKRGFFGLGKKKAPASYIEADANASPADIPMPPQHRRDPNRPLTPIGEDNDVGASENAQRSPKLQRRSAPQWGRSTSDSWPLPQPPPIGDGARPQSSDGVMNRRTSLRPTLSKRQSSQMSQARTVIDPNTGKEIVVGRTGKKKKFQGLRRVFGLND